MRVLEPPLMIELFAGLHGWGEGAAAEGYRVVGFDIFDMCKEIGVPQPAGDIQLVLQDVLTIHGKQCRDAAVIVASPPCQKFSYMAMPWSKSKQMRREYLDGTRDVKELTALFDACFRIQREAIEAAGHFIPLVVENVRGALEWVGRSRANYGSFHFWGDVPALMPSAKAIKVAGFRFDGSGKSFQTAAVNGALIPHIRDGHAHTKHLTNPAEHNSDHGHQRTDRSPAHAGTGGMERVAGSGHCQSADSAHPRYDQGSGGCAPGVAGQQRADSFGADEAGIKQRKSGRAWFADADSISGSTSSGSKARKAASAAIAKIPFPLAKYIAAVYRPRALIGEAS